jgi:predicted DNA-binding protein with PD1-like motif
MANHALKFARLNPGENVKRNLRQSKEQHRIEMVVSTSVSNRKDGPFGVHTKASSEAKKSSANHSLFEELLASSKGWGGISPWHTER